MTLRDPEIVRLRAEVERLTNQYNADGQHIQAAEDRIEELKRERDEALAALNDAKKALKIMNQNLDDLSRAKQEALAQVAVLIQGIERSWPSWPTAIYELNSLVAHLGPTSHALLDRLAMLEDGAMTNQRLVWLEDRLRRAAAVVEAVKDNHSLGGSECREPISRCGICQAFAAYEASK